MTICPTLSRSSPMGTKSTTKIDAIQQDDYYKQQRKKRSSLLKFVQREIRSIAFQILFLDCRYSLMI